LLLLAVFGALLPVSAWAAEGDVKLSLTGPEKNYLYVSFLFGLIALAYGFYLRASVLKQSPGDEKMQAVGKAIEDGALAYLNQQIRTMSIFVVVIAIGLFLLFFKSYGVPTAGWMAGCFILGVAASYIAGFTGMIMAVKANMRTANAALTSYKNATETAFRSGGVAGMVTVGMGLLGASLILLLAGENAMRLLIGFGFGGSLAALFMRVGGGIFTKAADVGADLVGKVEAGIPEDDPRNPATIADNVGDNVGDCAGMAADIFESYEVTLVAAIVLGAATSAIFDTPTWTRLVLFALMARGIGIIASILGIHSVRGTNDLDADPLAPIRKGFYTSAVIAGALTLVAAFLMMGGTGNPVKTSQLTAFAQVRNVESKAVAGLRAKIAADANAKVDDAKKVVSTVAAKTKKSPSALTLEDFLKDGQPIPEVGNIPLAAIQRAITGPDVATQPITVDDITPLDLVNSPELKAKGYSAQDAQSVAGAVAEADQPTAGVADLSGYHEVTDPNDIKDFPALGFATSAAQSLPG